MGEIRNMHIHIDRIEVDTIDTVSGIFSGINQPFSWSSVNKTNVFFQIGGNHNIVLSNLNDMDDHDAVDTNVTSTSYTS